MPSFSRGTRQTAESTSQQPWFAEWFNHPLYLQVYSHRDSAEAARCIRTIIDRTQPQGHHPGSVTILDIACGAGRHALELARLGYCVTGNDLSPFLLETARSEARACNLELSFTCCDMRHLPADNRYDLILQLFTSFGYFDTEEDDLRVVENVRRLLHPNGSYVLDLINPNHLQRNLVPVSRRTVAGLDVLEERSIGDNRITKKITITPPEGEPLRFTESVRLFSIEAITALLDRAGFRVASVAGDYLGSLFESERSPRMMLFAKKS
ncbi:MAG: methyltransferase domain-containing protein [Chlorobi bacterium]|nr:methyltransferase domain-containing protein [Chlorobiota bacterium]